MTRPRILVTGVGLITALGPDAEACWSAIVRGKCGIGPVDLFDVSPYVGKVGAQIRFPLPLPRLSRADQRRLSRCDLIGLAAAEEALNDAGNPVRDDRFGLAVGAGAGGMFDAERYHERFVKDGPGTRAPLRDLSSFLPDATAEWIGRAFGLAGPRVTVATACSSSATAIGIGADWIRSGRADRVLCGGADALSRVTWGGFNALRAVDPGRCRPFDRARGGISLGEGAGFLVLEREDLVRTKPRAVFGGYGVTSDAFHMTNPHPEGASASAAIRAALADAGIAPGDVDYVNAHGTGTPANDTAESKAIRAALGEATRACVSSTKSQVGHTLGAAGGVEAAVTVLAVERGVAPPNVTTSEIDPACLPVDVVLGEGRPLAIRHAVSNSFAFGGNNCALVFSKVAP
ncbi:MAG: beta-ketoacyl-[acyl-carrier-protein] synthase family protein [Planctomycetota bacterium]